jgi:hypothetical protein
LTDEEYQNLQAYLVLRPEAGDIIPSSGGCRKLRWGIEGRGKRGGIRLIYYFQGAAGRIYMLTIYAKNEAENIPSHILRKYREEIDHDRK